MNSSLSWNATSESSSPHSTLPMACQRRLLGRQSVEQRRIDNKTVGIGFDPEDGVAFVTWTEYQIGDVHARSCCFIGTSALIFTPKRAWSYAVQRGVGISITRA